MYNEKNENYHSTVEFPLSNSQGKLYYCTSVFEKTVKMSRGNFKSFRMMCEGGSGYIVYNLVLK